MEKELKELDGKLVGWYQLEDDIGIVFQVDLDTMLVNKDFATSLMRVEQFAMFQVDMMNIIQSFSSGVRFSTAILRKAGIEGSDQLIDVDTLGTVDTKDLIIDNMLDITLDLVNLNRKNGSNSIKNKSTR